MKNFETLDNVVPAVDAKEVVKTEVKVGQFSRIDNSGILNVYDTKEEMIEATVAENENKN